MENQDFNIARAAWSQKLVTYYFIDVGMLSKAIHDALPAAARQWHPANVISAMLTSDLAIVPERAGGWYRTVGAQEFLGVHIFVRRYSRWMTSLGSSLGYDPTTLLIEDDWVTFSLPELKAVLWGLMDRVRQDLAGARAISDQESIAEAFHAVRKSVSAGEHPHQTHARASRITHGLRLVC